MYITDSACISPQRTFDEAFFEGDIKVHEGDRYIAVEPAYGQLIPAGLLRRMGKAVRMGVGAGLPLIQNAQIEGIVLGTANGGLEDCLKFLNQIVDYNEGTLTPTNFVQSTPNAVAGNLALMSKTTGYNTTHVHKGLAFEAALLDTMLLLEEKRGKMFLVGSIEEISDYNHNIDLLAGSFKSGHFTSENLFTLDSPGSANGEGAAMFIVNAERTDDAVAQIRDVFQSNNLDEKQLVPVVNAFLQRNGLQPADIDAVIMGISGDNRTDHWYFNLQKALFEEANIYTYKNMVGDYPTGSAFATWMGAQVLAGKRVPEACVWAQKNPRTPKHILIYNHYKASQHGFILLRA
ncbi:beta-ketoacyl synthase chain length factor [Dyadobacter fermentans]|uniref:beta-ketoacyl synthase chain length factor n=1 Tax=Dyadobacter fermentans TaxID=94254 RepID=UPI001CBECF58|nr:beta-ketoacyl synthase chain length factor [Dyadobacter fermentans]MBZ1360336.1 beta-ketoacyl synthase chain length factor [Dyadobacter fermentans]